MNERMPGKVRSKDGTTWIDRFVALRFFWGWGVWDNLLGRFYDGIYRYKADAQEVAASVNADPARGTRHWYAGGTHFAPDPDDTQEPAHDHAKRPA